MEKLDEGSGEKQRALDSLPLCHKEKGREREEGRKGGREGEKVAGMNA